MNAKVSDAKVRLKALLNKLEKYNEDDNFIIEVYDRDGGCYDVEFPNNLSITSNDKGTVWLEID